MCVFCVFDWVVNSAVGPNQKQKRKCNVESFARKRKHKKGRQPTYSFPC